MKSYDSIASFYDVLSKLIFGNAIKNSQGFLIEAINAGSNILIIGGGTGWIIDEIAARNAGGLQITYMDISKKMICLAKQRNARDNKIEFINSSIISAQLIKNYDVVITPFILDNFSEENVEMVMDKINTHLKNKGFWLHADFKLHNSSLWQKILLKIMYVFFKITCNIEAAGLIETSDKFEQRGFTIVSEKNFYSNFIRAIIYRKE